MVEGSIPSQGSTEGWQSLADCAALEKQRPRDGFVSSNLNTFLLEGGNMRKCEKEGCEAKHKALGLCKQHYMSVYNRAYYAENREAMYAKARKWQAENPERKREHGRRRSFGYRKHLSDLMEDYAGMCGICGEDMFGLESDSDIHVDHIIPVSKGGTNDYDNLQPAHATCNFRKSAA